MSEKVGLVDLLEDQTIAEEIEVEVMSLFSFRARLLSSLAGGYKFEGMVQEAESFLNGRLAKRYGRAIVRYLREEGYTVGRNEEGKIIVEAPNVQKQNDDN